MFIEIVGFLLVTAAFSECTLARFNFLGHKNFAAKAAAYHSIRAHKVSPYEQFDRVTERALASYTRQEISSTELLRIILRAAHSVGGAYTLMAEHHKLIFDTKDDFQIKFKKPARTESFNSDGTMPWGLEFGDQFCVLEPTPFRESSLSFLYRGIFKRRGQIPYCGQVVVKVYKPEFIRSKARLFLWLEGYKNQMPNEWSTSLNDFIYTINPYHARIPSHRIPETVPIIDQFHDPNADLICCVSILTSTHPQDDVLAVLIKQADYFDYITGSPSEL